MNDPIYFDASPSAASLILGLRDFGYTLETAMADIIDNSITASASNIDIFTEYNTGQPTIGFLDDGHGMTASELQIAMRPGSKSPNIKRAADDLGRFGLGLKTASFSQARRLTVVTVKSGVTSCARWDLDLVQDADKWIVEIPSSNEVIPFAQNIKGANGTLVVWEKIDRLADESGSNSGELSFFRRIDDSINHLELVFHRFLKSGGGFANVVIRINNRELQAFDPFNEENSKTQRRDEILLKHKGSLMKIKAFTLPHHNVVSNSEYERFAGKEGYTRNQGFYLYRAGRLILRGTWFGLARQLQTTRLTRVRIDIPVALDSEWQINVLKASAQPPREIREELRHLVTNLGHPSIRVYKKRSRIISNVYKYPFWKREVKQERIIYKIDVDNPAIADFRSNLSVLDKTVFDHLISCLGRDFPVDTLFVDLGDSPEKIETEQLEFTELLPIMRIFTKKMVIEAVPRERIIAALNDMPIFSGQDVEIEKAIDAIIAEEKQ